MCGVLNLARIADTSAIGSVGVIVPTTAFAVRQFAVFDLADVLLRHLGGLLEATFPYLGFTRKDVEVKTPTPARLAVSLGRTEFHPVAFLYCLSERFLTIFVTLKQFFVGFFVSHWRSLLLWSN